jgi:Tfp pilus assembly protein PilN
MKNIVLIGVITVVLVAIYLFEEQRTNDNSRKSQLQRNIIGQQMLQQVSKIDGQNFHLLKEGNRFVTVSKKIPVAPERLDSLLRVLSGIKAIKRLPQEKIATQLTSIFANNTPPIKLTTQSQQVLTITLGSQLGYDTSFYLKITHSVNGTSYYVAEDTNPMNQLFMVSSSKQMHNSSAYHDRIKGLFYLTDNFFFSHKILSLPQDDPIIQLMVENIRNRPFMVNLKPFSTSPQEITFLSMDHQQKIKDYWQQTQQMHAQKYLPEASHQELKERVASLTLITAEKKHISLFLYRRWKEQAGHFLTVSNRPGIFQLDNKFVPLFFTNRQHLWERRPFRTMKVTTPKKLTINFKDHAKAVTLLWQRDLPIKLISPSDSEVKIKKIIKLISLLDIQEADYLSRLRRKMESKPDITISWSNNLLHLTKVKGELLITHPQSRTIFHVIEGHNVDKLPLQAEEYFANSP